MIKEAKEMVTMQNAEQPTEKMVKIQSHFLYSKLKWLSKEIEMHLLVKMKRIVNNDNWRKEGGEKAG